MPTLSCFYAIYTDGAEPQKTLRAPPHTDVWLGELPALVLPGRDDELFGPHADLFARFKPTRAFLLALTRDSPTHADLFFVDAREVLLQAVAGLSGVGLDVLRLWPFPLEEAAASLPEEVLSEDLFSMGIMSRGDHGFRAETFGLAKLGQRELSFAFEGAALQEDAALMCDHLADWLLEHSRRIGSGDTVAYGFDRLAFMAVEGAAGGPFRGWHPGLIQRLLPPSLFPGVGVLEVRCLDGCSGRLAGLTVPLEHSRAQRQVLEDCDVTGESPHASTTAQVAGPLERLVGVTAVRGEPQTSKDSGWRFVAQPGGATEVTVLDAVVARAPGLLPYLALPPGSRLEWDSVGALTMDLARVRADLEGLDDDGDDEFD